MNFGPADIQLILFDWVTYVMSLYCLIGSHTCVSIFNHNQRLCIDDVLFKDINKFCDSKLHSLNVVLLPAREDWSLGIRELLYKWMTLIGLNWLLWHIDGRSIGDFLYFFLNYNQNVWSSELFFLIVKEYKLYPPFLSISVVGVFCLFVCFCFVLVFLGVGGSWFFFLFFFFLCVWCVFVLFSICFCCCFVLLLFWITLAINYNQLICS